MNNITEHKASCAKCAKVDDVVEMVAIVGKQVDNHMAALCNECYASAPVFRPTYARSKSFNDLESSTKFSQALQEHFKGEIAHSSDDSSSENSPRKNLDDFEAAITEAEKGVSLFREVFRVMRIPLFEDDDMTAKLKMARDFVKECMKDIISEYEKIHH
jgi:hypothetical protein